MPPTRMPSSWDSLAPMISSLICHGHRRAASEASQAGQGGFRGRGLDDYPTPRSKAWQMEWCAIRSLGGGSGVDVLQAKSKMVTLL